MSHREPDDRWRHDVKNQLGVIVGFAELLIDEIDEANPMRADIEEIRKAGKRAMELVDELKVPAL